MADEHPFAYAETVLLISLGGFAGANARYATGTVLPPLEATLVANVVGSLLLGFVLYEEAYVGVFSGPLRYAIATGFLSSLSTYSTFAVQTFSRPELALVNVVANYALGLAGVFVGRAVVRWVRTEVDK